MKKWLLLAALLAFAAASAGCALHAVLPAFLLPAGLRPSPTATATYGEVTATPGSTPVAEPSPTPAPTPAPTPTPAPKPLDTLAHYQGKLPEGLAMKLDYDTYDTPLDYFVALKSGKVYSRPDTGSKKLQSFSIGKRYPVDSMVLGADGKSRWFLVRWADKNGKREGYVRESAGKARSFRLEQMLQRAKALKSTVDAGGTVFIANYKNAKGLPPALPDGKAEDEWGYRRSQSAPAYALPGKKAPFRYAPDGLLGQKLVSEGGFTKIHFPTFGETRWVPDKYVYKTDNAIGTLRQVIVVDRLHQNTAVFDHGENGWELVAMSYVSTGKPGKYSLTTPLGDFMAQSRHTRFYYYADGEKVIDGYAPWAIRFSGGGYLHGVPRKSEYDQSGKRYDPPAAEALHNLGTTPQSHMCVRNYTSFARFLYDRFEKGACAVIVME